MLGDDAPPLLEVRGEVYMPLTGFRPLNEQLAGDETEARAEPAQRRRRLAAAEGLRRSPPRARSSIWAYGRAPRGSRARLALGDAAWLRARGFRTNPFAERLQGSYRMPTGARAYFAGLREYAEEDDARHIDWNATARLTSPRCGSSPRTAS